MLLNPAFRLGIKKVNTKIGDATAMSQNSKTLNLRKNKTTTNDVEESVETTYIKTKNVD